jgi:hypothetical protein
MNREQIKSEVREAARRVLPGLGVAALDGIISSPSIQQWFDGIERKRPRGIVAWVRRLRGKQRGLTDGQRVELEEYIRLLASGRR